jgi:hypothetical protein
LLQAFATEYGAIGWTNGVKLPQWNGWQATGRRLWSSGTSLGNLNFCEFASGVTTMGMNRFKQQADIDGIARLSAK